MNTSAQQVLESFDQLPESEKQQVVAEILRRVIHEDSSPLSDDELVMNAEALFLELDRSEMSMR
ncbi:MAG: hypothetical protein IT324_19990 [Anaerolineae bacterium]|nr:hypothetical protein [Anaerolineae bacterium]